MSTIEALARYIEALGERLDLIANFDDHTLAAANLRRGMTCDISSA